MTRFNGNNSQNCSVMVLFDGIVVEEGNWVAPINDHVNVVCKKAGTGTVKFDIRGSADDPDDPDLQFKLIQSVTLDNTTPLVSVIVDPWNILQIVPTQIDAGITSFIVKMCN